MESRKNSSKSWSDSKKPVTFRCFFSARLFVHLIWKLYLEAKIMGRLLIPVVKECSPTIEGYFFSKEKIEHIFARILQVQEALSFEELFFSRATFIFLGKYIFALSIPDTHPIFSKRKPKFLMYESAKESSCSDRYPSAVSTSRKSAC